MVKQTSCGIRLEDFPISTVKSLQPVRSKDHIIFYNREIYLDESWVGQYLKNLNNILSTDQHLSDTQRLLLMTHLQRLNQSLKATRTYTTGMGNLLVDEKNELELIGAPVYAKAYQVIYDFSERLDVLLAYICGLPYQILHERLSLNLEKYGVDYTVFSIAVTRNDTTLLQQVPVGVFFGLSPVLDELFRQAMCRTENCTFQMRGSSVQIRTKDMTKAEIAYYAVGLQVWDLLQFIFEEFIRLYNANELLCPDSMHHITSKGHANIVIQADERAHPKPLYVSLADVVMEIQPKIFTRGKYYKVFLED